MSVVISNHASWAPFTSLPTPMSFHPTRCHLRSKEEKQKPEGQRTQPHPHVQPVVTPSLRSPNESLLGATLCGTMLGTRKDALGTPAASESPVRGPRLCPSTGGFHWFHGPEKRHPCPPSDGDFCKLRLLALAPQPLNITATAGKWVLTAFFLM